MKIRHYVAFGAGQVGLMLLMRFYLQWLLRFSSGESGVEGAVPLLATAAVGPVFFAFRIFDAVTDPIAGWFSDRWVQRGRERRTLLWFFFAFPGIGLVLAFLPDASMAEWLRWTLLVSGMFVFFASYTTYGIPYWSLSADLSVGQPSIRARLSSLLGVATLLAAALGVAVGPALVQRFGFLTAAGVFAAVATVLLGLPYFAQPRGHDVARPRGEAGTGQHVDWTVFVNALRDRRFMSVIILFSTGQMAFTAMTAAAPFITELLLGGTLRDVTLVLAPFLGTSLVSFGFVPGMSRRFGWERCAVVAACTLGIIYMGSGALGPALCGSQLLPAALLFAAGGPFAALLIGVEGEGVVACAHAKGGSVTSTYFGVLNLMVKSLNGLSMAGVGVLAIYGAPGVRAMGVVSGMVLVVGAGLFFWVRPSRALDPKHVWHPPHSPSLVEPTHSPDRACAGRTRGVAANCG